MFFVAELIVGAISRLIISLTGVGGGVVVLPVLTYFFVWMGSVQNLCHILNSKKRGMTYEKSII